MQLSKIVSRSLIATAYALWSAPELTLKIQEMLLNIECV